MCFPCLIRSCQRATLSLTVSRAIAAHSAPSSFQTFSFLPLPPSCHVHLPKCRRHLSHALVLAIPAVFRPIRRPSLDLQEFPNLAVKTQAGDFNIWE